VDPVSQVRKINSKWFVQGRLDKAAESYLNDLESTGDPRLLESCTFALTVLQAANSNKKFYDLDRKACFYPALFYFATPSESQRYLAPHKFTQSILSSLKPKRLKASVSLAVPLQKIAPTTQDKAKWVATLLRSSLRFHKTNQHLT
tara:strand:+ start:889 stop:1326 length:438 start_codon:yes stop_codon:yes gene_type:complete